MYAVIESGGKQYQVSPNDSIEVEKLKQKEGTDIEIEKVLLFRDETKLRIGRPYLKNVKVICKVSKHFKGRKVIAFKYKRRKSSKTKLGHRQELTRLRIDSIEAPDTRPQTKK